VHKNDGHGEIPDIQLPERIHRLGELAYNLWWSWHPDARNLFRSLDYSSWLASGHNPVKQLREMDYPRLEAAALDEEFLHSYDRVMTAFDDEMSAPSYLHDGGVDYPPGMIAFFSMEFAIHYSLPIYAGGLGVLAGDICKESSDFRLPLIGVGFMYPQGYFHQRISADGWQEEIYQLLDFSIAPISPCVWPEACGPLVEIDLAERKLLIKTWLVRIGRVNLYLLDTNIEDNSPQDRLLSARLYTADREQRFQQEFVLGVGGVRVLQELDYQPAVWHANEGHTSLMMMERLRQEAERGISFSEAVEKVQSNTIFTTHTPVTAGHDAFPVTLVEKYLKKYGGEGEVSPEKYLDLARPPDSEEAEFNMTVLGLRLSGLRNAVSEIHKKTSRKMWQSIWPGLEEEDVPIVGVTNGVHFPTWVAPQVRDLYENLDSGWLEKQGEPAFWQRISEVSDEELWRLRQTLKRTLVRVMLERNRKCSLERECSHAQVLAMGAMFDAYALTIGFARRFAEYKRPTLALSDINLLREILTDSTRPVQLVFAGKSHPADIASKSLMNEVYAITLDRSFEGRIAFVEDYDTHVAHDLVAGVDVWMNTPRRLEEACGTSGMKAVLNGALHFSVPDGWWYETFNGKNGWAIGDYDKPEDPWRESEMDARSVFQILKEKIIPLYYERDRAGVPHGWIEMIKESIRSIVPKVSSRRMMQEYAELYLNLSRERVK